MVNDALVEKLEKLKKRKIIQGGMGVGVSDWELARAVSNYIPFGESEPVGLGVVSATAPDVLLARGLQNGDSSGVLREALANFPNQSIARKILEKFFIEEGKAPETNYISNPIPTFEKTGDLEFMLKSKDLEDAMVAGAFVQIYLAKKGHDNPIGANFLNKIGMAQLPTLYGAMLAGLDVACIGAGFPKNIPEVLDAFESGNVGKMSIPINGKVYQITFDPKRIATGQLSRPVFLGIVGNHLGVRGLPDTDGYIFEGWIAGGHNPPARSKMLNEIGEPLYGLDDDMNFKTLEFLLGQKFKKTGVKQPYWLAGNYATRLGEALSCNASGVQVGTPFAFCKESRINSELKQQALTAILNGAKVYTSARASPTGFPFKELEVPGTMAIPEIYSKRERICNVGFLAELYEDDKGNILTRCPAEPEEVYERKGGLREETVGRKCLCNNLSATISLGMPGEVPLITSGANLNAVKDLVQRHGREYSAANVIDYILEKSRK